MQMTDKSKIKRIGGIPLQREVQAENRLPGDLVCKPTDPHHIGRVEKLHLGVEATVRWLETHTLERISVKELKKVGEAADEIPATFAELKPPGYWSKSAGYFVPVCKDEREPPSGKITIMKAPTQCALWARPELINELKDRINHFELLETFVDESHLDRDLLKCKECGQLYFFEFYEEIDWEDGDDPQYWTYIPVETGAEIETLKKASRLKLLECLPQLRRDWPKGAKSPKTYWAKNSQ
jgi:hypothetical protein